MARTTRSSTHLARQLAIVGVALVSAVGCAGGDDTLALDDYERDQRFDDLSRELYVRVAVAQGGSLPAGCTASTGCTVAQFATYLSTWCTQTALGNHCPSSGCQQELCNAEVSVCIAHTMLDVTELVAPRQFALPNGNSGFSVLPQGAAARSELARAAYDYGAAAFQRAAVSFGAPTAGQPAGTPTTTACTSVGFGSLLTPRGGASLPDPIPTLGSAFATTLAEGYHLALEATEATVIHSEAAADARLSTEGSEERARALAFNAPFASRGSAAHTFVGGEMGIPGLGTSASPTAPAFLTPIFPAERLSADGQQALEYLRMAGIDPAWLGSGVTMTQLIEGGGIVTASQYPLRVRLSQLLGDEDASTGLQTLPTAGFYQRLGVSEQGFVEARAYLAAEVTAFDRSRTAHAPAERLPNGHGLTPWTIFAGTHTAPQPPLHSWWAALLRYHSGPTGTFRAVTSGTTPPPFPIGVAGYHDTFTPAATPESVLVPNSLSAFEDGATMALRGVRTAPLFTGIAVEAVRARVLEVLGDLEAQSDGRVQFCWRWESGGAQTLDVHLWGEERTTVLYAVRGRDGLECAVHGTIDGAPCSMADVQLGLVSSPGGTPTTQLPWSTVQWTLSTTPDPTAGAGYARQLNGSFRISSGPVAVGSGPVQIYLVRARAGRPIDGPGDFEEYSGVWLPLPSAPTTPPALRYCTTQPINPDAEEHATRAASIDPTDGTTAATSCAGVPLGQRIPLENELTSDEGGTVNLESSWRHYLDLAEQAAARADALGEDVIRNGLEMDVRAEAAVDQLEDVCGVAINTGSLGDLANTTTTPRTAARTAMGACPAGYIDSGGSTAPCVLDPVEYATHAAASTDEDAQRLASCMGGGDSTVLVTLANVPVCVWWDGSNPDSICQSSTDSQPCPFEASNVATTSPSCDASRVPAGFVSRLVDHPLGYFGIPEDPTNSGGADGGASTSATGDPLPCEALARYRTSGRSLADLAEISSARASFFSAAGLQPHAESLGITVQADNVLRVTFDGTTLYRTGIPTGTAAISQWPCAEAPAGMCPAGVTPSSTVSGWSGPLYCVHAACGDPQERARMDDLLARAVMAARLAGGVSLRGLEVPFYPRAEEANVSLDNPTGWSLPDGPNQFRETDQGLLHSHPGGGGDYDDFGQDFDTLHARAQHVAGREWQSSPYDFPSTVAIFDDDDADQIDRSLPLFIRRLPEQVTGTNPNVAATQLWQPRQAFWNALYRPGDSGTELLLPATSGMFRDHPLTALTRYWMRSGCGTIGGAECNGFGGRDEGEGALAAAASRDCYSQTVQIAGSTADCNRLGCTGRYFQCVANASSVGVDFESTFDGNTAFIAPHGLTRSDILNGLELLCQASRAAAPDPTSFGCTGDPPEITTMTDVLQSEQFIRCRADAVRRRIGMTVLQDIPTDVVDRLQSSGPASLGGGGGELDAEVSQLAAALYELQSAQTNILSTADDVANAVSTLRHAVAQSQLASRIEDINLQSTILKNVTDCISASLTAAAHAIDNKGFTAGLHAGAAAATCVNAVGQTALQQQITQLRQQMLEVQTEEAITDFARRYQLAAQTLTDQTGRIQASLQQIDAALSRIRSLRTSARRDVARALFLDSDGAGRLFPVSTVMRRRYNTSLIRYQQAHQDAVRAAYIARRALEQRLGMRLDDMTEGLLLVEAPSSWVNTLCSLPAIDYDRIRAASPGTTGDRATDGSTFDPPADYAGSFVGDYVLRLRQTFESYSFAYPFEAGHDTAVLSLRDDIQQVRADCAVDTPNWLFHSGHFEEHETIDEAGWRMEGCAIAPPWPDGSTALQPSCILAAPLGASEGTGALVGGSSDDSTESPISFFGGDLGRVAGYRVDFGLPDPGVTIDDIRYESVGPGTRLIQWVDVPPGRYRVSWYERTLASPSGTPVIVTVSARRGSDGSLNDESALAGSTYDETPPMGSSLPPGWVRRHRFVNVPAGRVLGVGVSPGFSGSGPYGQRSIALAAMMVESAPTFPGEMDSTSRAGLYFDTGTVRERMLRTCEDTTGAEFRRGSWSYGCTTVCADGFDGACDPAFAEQRCFWETSFNMSSDVLQRIATTSVAGFAAGSHNYRVETIGLNFVGVGLHDCTHVTSGTPSTCYASGNLRYSLLHGGPFLVRNARGALYDAPLFPGRIESARGLEAERYLTNPLSSADQTLMAAFLRSEWRGRPLAGTVTLRIWDEPGLVFERLEDVQILLEYRYWTHQR